MDWTEQQEEAIKTPTGSGCLLVSAAAGSGKTAVLVERVLRKIIRAESSIDRLLIVTFTEAAAAEMREKIIKRLAAELNDSGHTQAELKFLKTQTHLAETADIMTIDAFCNRVVRNNFHVLGIDPNASIADTALCSMMRDEAFENLFDELYKSDDPGTKRRFAELIDAYASNRDEKGLADVIYRIYNFISSFAEPEKWLDNAAEMYNLPTCEMPFAVYLKNISHRAAKRCLEMLDEAAELAPMPEYYAEYAAELRTAAEEVAAADWGGIFAVYDKHFKKKKGRQKNRSKLAAAPDPRESEELANRLEFTRVAFADSLAAGVTLSAEELEKECDKAMLKRETDSLVWIVKLFMREYSAVKDKRSVKEFADIEHLAYSLFRDHADIRAAYTDKYDEILIDEYQDTNGLQDSIFTMISKRNIFMVGDLKQSIYRFRGGDPYIFRDKSEMYEDRKSTDNKIVLSQNFRSRTEILDSVNDVFGRIMSAEAGDVDYRDTELIVRDKSRDYYPPSEKPRKAHLNVLLSSDKDKAEIEFTADKIAELLKSGTRVYDKDTGEMRRIQCRDIVVLESSVKTNGKAITDALSERGIEAYTETETFFDRREISVMMSLLSVINNARQDIPLIALMRSPIGGFTDNELARIRLAYGGGDNFICAVETYASGGGIRKNPRIYRYVSGRIAAPERRRRIPLEVKCSDFLRNLRRWRTYGRSKSVAQLIWTIYEETYFYDMMGAIEEGEEAQFNLRLLYERACAYEKAGFKGLFNFAKYISQLKNRGEDLGGAKLIGENHDVVRIMTIHKSKGLEFPYVFVIGCGKRFNWQANSGVVPLHKDIGMGLPYIYYDEHYMRNSYIKDVVAAANKTELVSEQMRILYVALTRAREGLFVVVSQNDEKNEEKRDTPETYAKKQLSMLVGGKMIPSKALSAGGFYDWICPTAIASDAWDCKFCRIDTDNPQPAKPLREKKTDGVSGDGKYLRSEVYKILDYKYPFSEGSVIPSRTSVTQLKELTIERENIYDAPVYEPNSRRVSGMDDLAELMFSPLHVKPSFLLDSTEKPANEIGTLYHLVMCETDISKIAKYGADAVDDEVRRLIAQKTISESDLRYIDSEKIKAFYKSEIGKRILNSEEVIRERPFQINIPATEYDPALPEKYASENVILQGIIDCFFRENDGYILVDYKTDKVRGGNTETIRRKYAKQLDLYALAIEILTNVPVTEKHLYLFDTGDIL